MLSANLSTSTPKRRSTRFQCQKPRDELSSNDLSDISMVSSICSPVRDLPSLMSIDSVKKNKAPQSAMDSKRSKPNKISFRPPLAVCQDRIENQLPTIRRSARNLKENASEPAVDLKRKRKIDHEKSKTKKDINIKVSKRRRHLDKSDFIETDLDQMETSTLSGQIVSGMFLVIFRFFCHKPKLIATFYYYLINLVQNWKKVYLLFCPKQKMDLNFRSNLHRSVRTLFILNDAEVNWIILLTTRLLCLKKIKMMK